MIKKIEIKKNFDYENAFMLSAPVERIGKLITRFELFSKIKNIPGEIIECGVFKGSSLSQFVKLRALYGHSSSKKIIAFDTFGKFPEKCNSYDKKYLKSFTDQAGNQSIEKNKLLGIITDGDIRRAIDRSNYFFDMIAQDIMNEDFISVTTNELASKCLNMMAEKKIGCLAVMQNNELVGVINQKDLVKLGI